MNARKRKDGKHSRFKGVTRWTSKRRYPYWMAFITVNGRHIGRSRKTEREAALAYNDLAKRYFGKYARLNHVV